MTITDELRVVIEAEVERAVRDMGKWDKSVSDTEKKLDDLEKAADKMSNKLMLVSGGFLAAGAAGLKFAADVETQKTSLEVLTGSAETAAKVFEDLQSFAAKTPLSQDDVNNAATQLLNFGTSVEDVTATLKTLGDVSMGNAAKLDTVVRAYGRMQMKGKATMEELNMLTEAGVPILGELAKGMGVATDEIFKMAATGNVSFSDIQNALASLTGEGGKFNNMLERQSSTLSGKLSTALDNLKISSAKLMENVIPMAKDLLDALSRIAENFGSMDAGAKKALLSLLAIGVAAGPISKTGSAALGLVKAIMGLGSMNPVVLGIMALTVAVSALAGAFLLAKMNEKSFEEGLATFKESQKQALASSKSYNEMSATLPALTKSMYDAAKATGQFDKAIEEAGKLQKLRDELSKLEKDVGAKTNSMKIYFGSLRDALSAPINSSSNAWFEGPANAEQKMKTVKDALNALDGNMKKVVQESGAFKDAFDAKNFKGMLDAIDSLTTASPEVKKRIEEIKKEISEIGSGATITPKVVFPTTSESRKTWQDWWQEITGVDKTTFSTGAEAAKIYLNGVGSELGYAQAIGVALGEKIDPTDYLKKEQENIKKTLVDLLKIDPKDINEKFNFGLEYDDSGNAKMDASIKALIDRYKELTKAIAQADDQRKELAKSEELSKRAADLVKTIETPLERYKKQLSDIDEIWKNQQYEGQWLNKEQLIRATTAATSAYKSELAAVGKEQEAVKNMSFEEWITKLTEEWLKSRGAADDVASSLANIGAQIAMASIDSMVDGFKELGAAWADGSVSAEEFGSILASIAKKVLDMLPMLFVQAGLQIIATNPANWALGLGFIMGGLSTAIIAGLTEGAAKSAKGNVFDSGALIPFAQGGAFTNGIVRKSTIFNMGEMGEKGPEAIVPLARMSNGALGVASAGSGPTVSPVTNVNVMNFSGQKVQTKEKDNGSSRDIEIMIGSINEKLTSEGRYDNANTSRYQMRKRVVRG